MVSNRVLEHGAVLEVTNVWDFRDVLAGARANLFFAAVARRGSPDLAHISRDTFDVLRLIDERYEITPQDTGYAGLIRDAANKGSPMLEEPTQETQQNLLRPPPEIFSRIARSALADTHARERLEKVVKYSLPANSVQIMPGAARYDILRVGTGRPSAGDDSASQRIQEPWVSYTCRRELGRLHAPRCIPSWISRNSPICWS